MNITINESTYPLPESVRDLTFFKNFHWGKKCLTDRRNCFGILEKDKIVMHEWIGRGGFPRPELHYSAYADAVTVEDIRREWSEHPRKFLVIKLSHLQSGWGVRVLPPYDTTPEDDIDKIWDWCRKGFESCFCCNLDSEHQTFRASLEDRTVLYRSIQPGVLIQDFHGSRPPSFSLPREIQVYVIGGEIMPFGNADMPSPKVRELSLEVARYLGADYLRVDIYQDEQEQNPVIGEISLSPNLARLGADQLKRIEGQLKISGQMPSKTFPELQALCARSPIRTHPLKNYCYDLDVASQKRRITVRLETSQMLRASGARLFTASLVNYNEKRMQQLANPVVHFLYRHIVVPLKTIRQRIRRENCHRMNR